MTTQYHGIARFHDGHCHAMIRQVDRVFVRGTVWTADSLTHKVLLGHKFLIHASIGLLELNVGAWHAGLIERLAKVLLKV